MSNTVSNQKSQLARLMATENLSVEHQKLSTAKFDPMNRVLYLPIWKDMSGHLYDHLVGHEVGHALDTPADGWHDAVVDKTKGKGYKGFLNVIEDARIEKRQKRRYPGLRTSFQKGFENLMERDFFGLKTRDINTMSFIDRLNVYTKSQYTADFIRFSPEEKAFIDRVQKLETWSDVLRLTDEIYAYSKEEQFEMHMQDLEGFGQDNSSNESDEQYESDGDEFGGDQEMDDDGEETKSPKGSDDDSEDDADSEDSEETEDDEESGKAKNRFKESNPAEFDQFDPTCETDENYREKESELLDNKSKTYAYYDLPKPNMENLITPSKIVHANLKKHFDNCIRDSIFTESEVREWINEFKTKNEKYINLLVKEFEMRKAANSYSKSKMSDTGDIDLNKLASYRIDDNIFRKVMLTPKGKNHGMILLLDKSGSMSENMEGSIEQILILTMFCRKVNIPFEVYGFSDSVEVIADDEGVDRYNFTEITDLHYREYFEKKENNVAFKMVRVRQYLHSQMSNVEFSAAVRNMIMVKKCFTFGGRSTRIPRPQSEMLSNTPLNQAIYTCGFLMKDFKKKFALDLTSLVIVHDGEADYNNAYWWADKNKNGELRHNFMNYAHDVCIIRDRKHHFEAKLDGRGAMTSLIQEWFKHVTGGAKIFGFFLAPKHHVSRAIADYYHIDGKLIYEAHKHNASYVISDLRKKFMKEKFLACENQKFDGFYLVSGGDELVTDQDKLEIDGNVTNNKLKNAFMKFNKNKSMNRVFVTTFITKMATH